MTLSRSRLVAPALAVALALVAIVTHAQGVDVAAATYRVELFARSGLTLWDSQWYGGHWTFNYSVIFAPIGWLTGIPLMEIVCVAVAAWAFDRLAVAGFGPSGRIAAIVFAAGTIVQVSIGQEPYLLGETIGLVALVAAHARRWPLALPLAVACSLASPLSGGFVALAALAWTVGIWPERRWGLVALAAAASIPIGALELLFPGQGMMPFATINFVGMTVGCLALGAVVAVRRHRALTAGLALYTAALVFTYAVPSAIGANITRLGTSFGVALVVGLAAENRRWRALLVAAAVPIALAQWVPALSALTGQFSPSMRVAYFQPLIRYLHRADDRPLGRVEVVPTADHWEAAYVAPSFPLARGWERQLDTANNAIFYDPGKLTPASYHAWLFANGVRFVALPDVALDYAAKAEGRLVRHGVPGLTLVWHSAHWRVYSVAGAPGIVSGPAQLVSEDGAQVVLAATRPGSIVVRERYVPAWHVTRGHASVSVARGGWLRVRVSRPGRVELRIDL